MGAEDMYLAAIDGPDPKEWQPWGLLLRDLPTNFTRAELGIPDDLPGKDYRFRIKLQRPDTLMDRREDQWTRFVGAIVDGDSSGEDLERIVSTYSSFCTEVFAANGAWCRKLGFFVVVVYSRSADKQLARFVQRLKERTYYLLANRIPKARISVFSIADEDIDGLQRCLKFCNQALETNDCEGT